jgi:hypothetical protein
LLPVTWLRRWCGIRRSCPHTSASYGKTLANPNNEVLADGLRDADPESLGLLALMELQSLPAEGPHRTGR